MRKFLVLILGGLAFVVFTLVLTALFFALPTMLLWNWLIPHVSNGVMPTITFFQAIGINFLCGLLFKSSSSDKK
jgi:hypothetical protein